MANKEDQRRNVFYRLLFPERQEDYTEACADRISYGGILIRCRQQLKVGSLVEIEIETGLQKKEKLRLLGEVKWIQQHKESGEFGAGIFYRLPTAGRMFKLFMDKNAHYLGSLRAASVPPPPPPPPTSSHSPSPTDAKERKESS